MSLERHYRRLLLAYPPSYRERRGDEIVATLLDSALPGQRRPDRHDVADLVLGGVRERLGRHDGRGLAGGLALVEPLSLVLAAAYPASYWIMGARSPFATGVALV